MDKVGVAVTGRFRPCAGAPVEEGLAGKYACFVAVRQTLVLPEHVADLASTDADIACRHVRIFPDMTVKLCHEGLAEAHDLALRPTTGIEVGPPLAAADRHAGQGILEGLFEAEKLDDADVDGRMKANAALVGPQCRIELDPKAAVDLNLALIVDPGHAEDDLSFRLADALDQRILQVARVLCDHPSKALQDFPYGLMELYFACVAPQDLLKDRLKLLVYIDHDHTTDCAPNKQMQIAIAESRRMSIRFYAQEPCRTVQRRDVSSQRWGRRHQPTGHFQRIWRELGPRTRRRVCFLMRINVSGAQSLFDGGVRLRQSWIRTGSILMPHVC